MAEIHMTLAEIIEHSPDAQETLDNLKIDCYASLINPEHVIAIPSGKAMELGIFDSLYEEEKRRYE